MTKKTRKKIQKKVAQTTDLHRITSFSHIWTWIFKKKFSFF